MKDESKKINGLYKLLYNAARTCVAPRFQEDAETIKEVRDNFTETNFGRNYKDLTESELLVSIDYLYIKSGSVKTDKATINQLKLLRFYQFQCGIAYCEWDKAMFKFSKGEGEPEKVITGAEAKVEISHLIDNNQKIPKTAYCWMYENWINPISHRFLIEGGFKTYVKNKYNFHYEYLNPDDCGYLIQRFGQMYMQLLKRGELNYIDLKGRLN